MTAVPAPLICKIAGTDGRDGLNGCPTVMGLDGPVASVILNEVLVQDRKLTPEDRAGLDLDIPDDEDVIVMPSELYLRGVQKVVDDV